MSSVERTPDGDCYGPCGNPLIFRNKHNGIRFSFSCGSNDTSNGAKQWFAENRHAIASTQNSQPPHARRWRAAASHLAEEHRGGGSSFDLNLRSKIHQNTIRWWNCCDSYEFNLIMFGCLFRCWFQRCNFTSLSRRGPLFDATEEELRSMMGYKPVVRGHHEDGQWLSIGKGGRRMWKSMDIIELQFNCKGYRILRRDFVIVFLWRMWGFCCWLETNHFWRPCFFLGSTTHVWLMRLAGIKVLWWSKVSQPDSCPRRWPVWNGLCRGSCLPYFFSSVVYTLSQEISYDMV